MFVSSTNIKMKRIFILTAFALFLCIVASAKRIPAPYCSACEYTIPVAELPDSAQFYTEEYNAYVDIGYIYKQFWAVWIPLWNYDGKYCLLAKDQDVYFEVTEEELKKYQAAYNLDLPENPISLWNKIGGKVLLLLIIGGGIWAYTGNKKSSANKEEFFNK
jgi:hypothetical protein